MRYLLRRTNSHISVTYFSGDFSNNLFGRDFELEKDGDNLTLHINLGPNLRVRNKAANCYSDAKDLVENHQDLKFLQLFEAQIIDGMSKVHSSADNPNWRLILHLAENEAFEYCVVPGGDEHSIFLYVDV